jgi:hypothetical protein
MDRLTDRHNETFSAKLKELIVRPTNIEKEKGSSDPSVGTLDRLSLASKLDESPFFWQTIAGKPFSDNSDGKLLQTTPNGLEITMIWTFIFLLPRGFVLLTRPRIMNRTLRERREC